jgi:hypothetical protein
MCLKVKPTCVYCNKQCKRDQELRRHLREKHLPWFRCPFCRFEWTRPDKIKRHIKSYHRDKFTAELLGKFDALRGQKIIEFLNGH